MIEELARYILERAGNKRLIVGVNGKDGSGKTYMADQLANTLHGMTERHIIRVSIDDFFNPRSVRKRNLDQARGCYEDTFNIRAFRQYALEPLSPDGNGRYRSKSFDYYTDSIKLSTEQTAADNAITIIDGVYLFRDDTRSFFDIKVLIEVDKELCIQRGVQRDMADMGGYEIALEKYQNRYMPSQDIYFKEVNPVQYADVIIDNNDLAHQVVRFL
ncbi:MAG: P-loop NTPase fold protein [Candidatus Saccharimonadales bacterium]